MIKLLSFLLTIISLHSFGQNWQFVKKIDVGQQVTAFDIGSLGKLYLGTSRGNVYSYEPDGTPDKLFSSAVFQPVTSIDASNSLRVFVYYASSGEFEFLERFSSQARTYTLDDFGLKSADCAGLGGDGSAWFMDGLNLTQVNLQTGRVQTSLELEIPHFVGPSRQLEVNRPVIISDQLNVQVQVGDEFNKLSGESFSRQDDEVIVLSSGELVFYSLDGVEMKRIEVPRSGVEGFTRSADYYHFIRGQEVWVYKIVE